MDDALTNDQFVAIGGTWSGLFLDDEDAPLLTWTFTFDMEPVGEEVPTLVVDSVRLSRSRWRDMMRRSASADAYGQPIEASLFAGSHHRYDAATVDIVDQRGTEIRVHARLNGDLDALGVNVVDVEAWLEFEGITVQLDEETKSVDKARARLAELTEVEGLVGDWKGWSFLFRPGVS